MLTFFTFSSTKAEGYEFKRLRVVNLYARNSSPVFLCDPQEQPLSQLDASVLEIIHANTRYGHDQRRPTASPYHNHGYSYI